MGGAGSKGEREAGVDSRRVEERRSSQKIYDS